MVVIKTPDMTFWTEKYEVQKIGDFDFYKFVSELKTGERVDNLVRADKVIGITSGMPSFLNNKEKF